MDSLCLGIRRRTIGGTQNLENIKFTKRFFSRVGKLDIDVLVDYVKKYKKLPNIVEKRLTVKKS
jgi:hypothetical protein